MIAVWRVVLSLPVLPCPPPGLFGYGRHWIMHVGNSILFANVGSVLWPRHLALFELSSDHFGITHIVAVVLVLRVLNLFQ